MAQEAKKEGKRSEAAKDIEVARPVRALSAFDEMDRMFDRWLEHFYPRGWLRQFRTEWPAMGAALPFEGRMPKVDVVDRDEDVVVRAELPGIEKDEVEISVADNTVTIKGESKREEKEEKGDYYRCEISHGAFARTVVLPHNVNAEAGKATFKDGVLELTLPKVEKAKRRSIKID